MVLRILPRRQHELASNNRSRRVSRPNRILAHLHYELHWERSLVMLHGQPVPRVKPVSRTSVLSRTRGHKLREPPCRRSSGGSTNRVQHGRYWPGGIQEFHVRNEPRSLAVSPGWKGPHWLWGDKFHEPR